MYSCSGSIRRSVNGPPSVSYTHLVTIIACGMIFFKLKLHLLMMSCWVVCALFARRLGYTYTELEVGAYELIQRAMGAVIILTVSYTHLVSIASMDVAELRGA